jgi:hypothetical protein
VRRDRRLGFPIENPLLFYPRLAWEYLTKYSGAFAMSRRYRRILAEVMADANPDDYSDTAMSPVTEAEEQTLDLFTVTVSAQRFVEKRRAMAARRNMG